MFHLALHLAQQRKLTDAVIYARQALKVRIFSTTSYYTYIRTAVHTAVRTAVYVRAAVYVRTAVYVHTAVRAAVYVCTVVRTAVYVHTCSSSYLTI